MNGLVEQKDSGNKNLKMVSCYTLFGVVGSHSECDFLSCCS